MTYAATTRLGPRVALAVSADELTWERLGLADFALEDDLNLNACGNKDAVVFPELVEGPDGRPTLAMLHWPMYQALVHSEEPCDLPPPASVTETRESIWISYADPDAVGEDIGALRRWKSHRLLAAPVAEWERVKIGAGTPPLLTHLGWLVLYNGVSVDRASPEAPKDPDRRYLRYCAGALVLDRDDPRRVLYRSPEPILEPVTREEREGAVSNVVFPTGLDLRGAPEPGTRVDVYYGMADSAVGVGWPRIPEMLPDAEPDALEAAS